MQPRRAEFLLFMVTAFWGSSYLMMKMGLESIGEFNLIALRFGLAFVLAGAIFFKRLRHINRKTWQYGALLGFILFAVFTAITFGLKTTTTSNAGFLVSLTVIFVPLINIILFKKKLESKLIISLLLAIIGIAFLTVKLPFKMTPGDLLCMATALFYAIHITVVGFAAKEVDTLNLGILQLGFAALFGLSFSVIFEVPVLPTSTEGWISILYLGIICSALGFILQVVAQKYTPPSRTGLIFSLEPVFAALFGFLFADEIMSVQEYFGATLVFLGVLISTAKKEQLQPAELTKQKEAL
ncbi:DMT family transporter [Pseudoneobacillus sp. C159]